MPGSGRTSGRRIRGRPGPAVGRSPRGSAPDRRNPNPTTWHFSSAWRSDGPLAQSCRKTDAPRSGGARPRLRLALGRSGGPGEVVEEDAVADARGVARPGHLEGHEAAV